MVSIIPVKGGQYRFAYKCEPAGVSHLGIFHSYAAVEASLAVDLYVEALTPENEIPAHFVGLLGLPELRRDSKVHASELRLMTLLLLIGYIYAKILYFRAVESNGDWA